MTLQELSEHYQLRAQLEKDEDTAERVQQQLFCQPRRIAGGVGGVQDAPGLAGGQLLPAHL